MNVSSTIVNDRRLIPDVMMVRSVSLSHHGTRIVLEDERRNLMTALIFNFRDDTAQLIYAVRVIHQSRSSSEEGKIVERLVRS